MPMLYTHIRLNPNVREGIKPMTRDSQMQYICIGGDTETNDGDANCFQLSYDGKDANVYFTRANRIERDFLAVLDGLPNTRDRQYVVWFHHLPFDLPVLFATRHRLFRNDEFDFDSHGWNIKGVYSHLCFATLRKGEKCVQILDTFAYFVTSLAKLADTFCPDLPKLKVPSAIGKKFYTEKNRDFIQYAKRDAVICQIVGSRIIGMHEKYCIPLSVSAPHMASRIFRRQFLKEPIPLPNMGVVYSALHSYHGGKNNFPIRRGLYKNVSCLDIKSAYPFAMAQLPSFSNRDLYYQFHAKSGFRSVPAFGIYKISGIAHATPWPIIFGHGFKSLYGEFSGVWVTGFELNRALETGLATITECFGYYYDAAKDKVASPFKAYVDHFFSMKEKKGIDKGERDFYKLLLNSLYGKFIETRGGSSLLNISYDIDTREVSMSLELLAGGLFNPFIATLITGHTRAYIHALELDFAAIHTSTDGIMTQSTPSKSYLSEKLGGLSIEAKGDVLLLRNKLYIVYTNDKGKAAKSKTGESLKSKIYRGKYIQKYALHGFFADVNTLEEMVITGVNEYEFTKVNKLRESLRRGLKVNRFEKQQRVLNLPEE